jgi:hypothetical protein
MTNEFFGKYNSIIQMLRLQQESIRDIVSPSLVGQIQAMSKAARGYTTKLEAIYSLSSSINSEQSLGRSFAHLGRISDLVNAPVLRQIQEATKAAQGYSAALNAASSLTPMNKLFHSAHLVGVGGGILEATFRHAQLDSVADSVRLASIGIPKLVIRASKVSSQSSAQLLDIGADFVESSFEDSPSGVVADVPAEIFRAIDLDCALSGEVEETVEDERIALSSATSDELSMFLEDLDPELLRLRIGACNAARSTNPDKVRHTCISLRELCAHALRILAPDSAIRAWSQDPSCYHEGRPTRRARVMYLYESIQSPALKKFIDADISLALELFNLLNKGTHVANLEIAEEQTAILLSRAEGVLLVLLKLARIRQNDF